MQLADLTDHCPLWHALEQLGEWSRAHRVECRLKITPQGAILLAAAARRYHPQLGEQYADSLCWIFRAAEPNLWVCSGHETEPPTGIGPAIAAALAELLASLPKAINLALPDSRL